jgi:hypothetical protein
MATDIMSTYSKAGTIINESSHFLKNAGTKDLAYGQTRAAALAVSNSTGAINNADSHEYSRRIPRGRLKWVLGAKALHRLAHF